MEGGIGEDGDMRGHCDLPISTGGGGNVVDISAVEDWMIWGIVFCDY